MAEHPTGIAGATHHATPRPTRTCHVCGTPTETPYAMRVMPGGAGVVCSVGCAGDARWTADPITELVRLRAQMLRMLYELEAIGELPARKRGPAAVRIADRIRDAIMAPSMVEACRR